MSSSPPRSHLQEASLPSHTHTHTLALSIHMSKKGKGPLCPRSCSVQTGHSSSLRGEVILVVCAGLINYMSFLTPPRPLPLCSPSKQPPTTTTTTTTPHHYTHTHTHTPTLPRPQLPLPPLPWCTGRKWTHHNLSGTSLLNLHLILYEKLLRYFKKTQASPSNNNNNNNNKTLVTFWKFWKLGTYFSSMKCDQRH